MIACIAPISCPELAPIMEILNQLEKTGSEYSGVSLKGLERTDSDSNNAEVLGYLGESGREFGELFDFELKYIAEIGAKEYDDRIQKAFNRAVREAKKEARAFGKGIGLKGKALKAYAEKAGSKVNSYDDNEKWSKQTASAVLRACMKMYMDIVVDHIKKQFAPGGVKPLSEKYEPEKRRAVGFSYPIGKRTGQLLENLDPTNAAGRMKLEK